MGWKWGSQRHLISLCDLAGGQSLANTLETTLSFQLHCGTSACTSTGKRAGNSGEISLAPFMFNCFSFQERHPSTSWCFDPLLYLTAVYYCPLSHWDRFRLIVGFDVVQFFTVYFILASTFHSISLYLLFFNALLLCVLQRPTKASEVRHVPNHSHQLLQKNILLSLSAFLISSLNASLQVLYSWQASPILVSYMCHMLPFFSLYQTLNISKINTFIV